MPSTQDKFTTVLRKQVEAHKLELIVDYGYTNVGVMRVQAPGRFDDVATLTFDFQGGSSSITVRSNGDSQEFYSRDPSELHKVLSLVESIISTEGTS